MVLHGSTRRAAWGENEQHRRRLDPFRSEDAITVFPAAWDEAMWWSDRQIANLAAILDDLRARYHIDTNRCTLTGVSDGGTGTFYHALRAPTPWAAFLPLIGHPWVLGNPEEEADGDIFAANLSGRSLMVINGADDPLYPAASLPS
jgi:predicted peptidase